MVNFSGFTHFVFKYHLFIICPSQDQVFTLSTYIVDFLKFHKLLSSLGAATTCFRYIWPRSSNCNNWDNPEIDYLTLIIEIIWSGGSENQLRPCGDDDQGENPGLWDFDIPRKVRLQWDFYFQTIFGAFVFVFETSRSTKGATSMKLDDNCKSDILF